jgi:PA14 domain
LAESARVSKSPAALPGDAAPFEPAARARSHPIRDVRDAALAEIGGFLAVLDACAIAPPTCAALVRAWHAMAALEAALRGDLAPSASDLAASARAAARAALAPALIDTPEDFVRRVFSCAESEPGAPVPAPTDRELRRHRRVLLRAFTRLDRQVRRRLPSPWRRRMAIGAAAVVFALAVLAIAMLLYRPRWRVSYYPNVSLSGAPVLVSRVPTATQTWGFSGPGPGLPADGFSARFETCLRLPAPATVEFTVGSDDGSRLFVDARQVLDAWVDQGYTMRDASIPLAAGVHPVRLDFYERAGSARVTFAARIAGSTTDLTRRLGLPSDEKGTCRP